VEAVDTALNAPHTFTKVEHAQHFAFLTVCPSNFADQEPVICKDPPGFDRARFHQQLNEALATFFAAHL
jgi:predicted dienelactone hydrolase